MGAALGDAAVACGRPHHGHGDIFATGTFTLRCLADDGGLSDDKDITVTVTP